MVTHKTSWSLLEFWEETFIKARWCCKRVQTKTSGDRSLCAINHLFHSSAFGLLFWAVAERGRVSDCRSMRGEKEKQIRMIEEEEERDEEEEEKQLVWKWTEKCCVMSQFVNEEICHWFCVTKERKHMSYSPEAPTSYRSPASLKDSILPLKFKEPKTN